MTVTDSTFSGKSGAEEGGGIANDQSVTGGDGTLNVTDSTFSDNTALDGGRIFSNDAPLTVTDTTLSGNTAPQGHGGGLYSFGDPLTVTDTTLSGNNAPDGVAGGSTAAAPSPSTTALCRGIALRTTGMILGTAAA